MQKSIRCDVCKVSFLSSEMMPSAIIRESVSDIIKKSNPKWSPKSFICFNDLNKYRNEYVQSVLEQEKGELSSIDYEVVRSMQEHETIAKNINSEFEQKLGFAQKLSDKITLFVGSWPFIVLFFIFLFSWVALNAAQLLFKPFDPYPFIFLNLFLSCLAAVQAPVILMSQNRQVEKDRLQSEHDYKINMKAELEIRLLHAKLDQLLSHQWQRLLEIQQMQMEMLEQVIGTKKMKK